MGRYGEIRGEMDTSSGFTPLKVWGDMGRYGERWTPRRVHALEGVGRYGEIRGEMGTSSGFTPLKGSLPKKPVNNLLHLNTRTTRQQ